MLDSLTGCFSCFRVRCLFRVIERLGDEFNQVFDLNFLVEILPFDCIVHHDHAVRAADGDGLGFGFHELV